MKRMTSATAVVALLFLLTVGAPHASAVTYDFTSCHVTGGCGTAPYGTVTLLTNLTGGVDVTVALETGAYFVKTGSGDSFAFKFVGAATGTSAYAGSIANGDITISSPLSPALTVFGPGPAALPAPPHTVSNFDGDGTGWFSFGIYCASCSNGGAGKFAGPINFTVADATIADLTVANSLGNLFVADVLLPNGKTGPIDVHVPDGGMTLMFLGGALVGLETLRRRFTA